MQNWNFCQPLNLNADYSLKWKFLLSTDTLSVSALNKLSHQNLRFTAQCARSLDKESCLLPRGSIHSYVDKLFDLHPRSRRLHSPGYAVGRTRVEENFARHFRKVRVLKNIRQVIDKNTALQRIDSGDFACFRLFEKNTGYSKSTFHEPRARVGMKIVLFPGDGLPRAVTDHENLTPRRQPMTHRVLDSGKKLRFTHRGTVKLPLELRPLCLLAPRPQFFSQRDLRVALRQRYTIGSTHSFQRQTVIR